MQDRLATKIQSPRRFGGSKIIGFVAVASLSFGRMTAAEEDFKPTESIVIEATAAKWNGQALPVRNGQLTLNVRDVRIPRHVQVTFKGFRQVRLNAEGSVVIAGTLILDGRVGGDGEPGRGGQAGRGGHGGDGAGAGLPGQGGSPNGEDGRTGSGGFGPGHPERRSDAACTPGGEDPAGGAAGGSNGTPGGRSLGCWQGGARYWEGDVLGRDEAFDPTMPPGGGSGGGGGYGRPGLAGGGGGGGGSSGGLEIDSFETIIIEGLIRSNGGPGGIGGDGARQRPGEACAAEGNACGGAGGGGAGGAGGYIVLQARRGEILLRGSEDFDIRSVLQADGGAGGPGGEGRPTGAQGPPGGGGRIRLVARGGAFKEINGRRTPLPSQPGRPACWIDSQNPNCALSALPGLASIYVSDRPAAAGFKEYIYVNGHPVAKVEH